VTFISIVNLYNLFSEGAACAALEGKKPALKKACKKDLDEWQKLLLS
jgi:hypothetical protein